MLPTGSPMLRRLISCRYPLELLDFQYLEAFQEELVEHPTPLLGLRRQGGVLFIPDVYPSVLDVPYGIDEIHQLDPTRDRGSSGKCCDDPPSLFGGMHVAVAGGEFRLGHNGQLLDQ